MVSARTGETAFAANLRNRYGMTVVEYEDMYREQGGKCAICRKYLSSNGATRYTVTVWGDGTASCDCPGWTIKRSGKERTCKHILGKVRPLPPTAAATHREMQNQDGVSPGAVTRSQPQPQTGADFRRRIKS